MKIIYDGFAIKPKICYECHNRFIFEKYISFEREFIAQSGVTFYVCKSCHKKKLKEKELKDKNNNL